MAMARETKGNRDFSPRTIDTARWAREQIKRQTGMSNRRLLHHPDIPSEDSSSPTPEERAGTSFFGIY